MFHPNSISSDILNLPLNSFQLPLTVFETGLTNDPVLLFSVVFWSEIDSVFTLPALSHYVCAFKVIFSFLLSTKSHELSWVQMQLSSIEEVKTLKHKVM